MSSCSYPYAIWMPQPVFLDAPPLFFGVPVPALDPAFRFPP